MYSVLLRLAVVLVLVDLGGVGFLVGGPASKILHFFSFLPSGMICLLGVGGMKF